MKQFDRAVALVAAAASLFVLIGCNSGHPLPEIGGELEASARQGATADSSNVPYHCDPVNPAAGPEARQLLRTLCGLRGKRTLTGQHNFTNFPSRDTDRVHSLTGKYPGIWSSDFGFTGGEDKDSITHRDRLIEEAKRQWAAGSLVMLSWHQVRPIDPEPAPAVSGYKDNVKGKLTDQEWDQLVTPGTALHEHWMKSVDSIATYLKALDDVHVPVLWRPLHESNGDFFWWGGRPGAAGAQQLFRELFDRMTRVDHVNNLIWVWDQNVPGGRFADYFPGQAYVDVLACDNYGPPLDAFYDSMLKLANGKPVAFGELRAPSPDLLRRQPNWVWFVVWAGMEDSRLKTTYDDPHALSRGEQR